MSDLYAAGAKTVLLEELIVLGEMEPSVAGPTRYIEKDPAALQRLLGKGLELDAEATPTEEQRRLKKRCSDFRRDVLKHTPQRRYDEWLEKPQAPLDTRIAQVNQHHISLGEYRAVYGAASERRPFQGVSKASISRLILFYAMADLADRHELVPQRVRKDIRLCGELFLIAVGLARQAVSHLLGQDVDRLDLKAVHRLMQYPKVVEVKDWLLAHKAHEGTVDSQVVIKEEFITETAWSLQRVLAPKHSIHL